MAKMPGRRTAAGIPPREVRWFSIVINQKVGSVNVLKSPIERVRGEKMSFQNRADELNSRFGYS